VVLCPSTTFGSGDYGPVAHGKLVKAAAEGKVPFHVRGQRMEVVDVADAARAFLLAEQFGRAGERYIISERMMSSKDIVTTAAKAAGHRPPLIGIPLVVMKLIGLASERVAKLCDDCSLDRVVTACGCRTQALLREQPDTRLAGRVVSEDVGA
jgi:dihydroflavonol-4-reductase